LLGGFGDGVFTRGRRFGTGSFWHDRNALSVVRVGDGWVVSEGDSERKEGRGYSGFVW
jgi:hypothetical protein